MVKLKIEAIMKKYTTSNLFKIFIANLLATSGAIAGVLEKNESIVVAQFPSNKAINETSVHIEFSGDLALRLAATLLKEYYRIEHVIKEGRVANATVFNYSDSKTSLYLVGQNYGCQIKLQETSEHLIQSAKCNAIMGFGESIADRPMQ